MGIGLPGKGQPHNLVDKGEYSVCPCCGSVWKEGRPWTQTSLSVRELAAAMKVSVAAVNKRIRKGTIQAYLGVNGQWVIPINKERRNP